ncbi:MAG: hypothetical protein ACRD1X_22320 [Vicinamibacteria bacterium]
MGAGAHVPPTVRRERDRIYTQLVESGLTRPYEIAKAAQELPQFSGVRYGTIRVDAGIFLKRTGCAPARPSVQTQAVAVASHSFDSIVSGFTMRLPLGAMGEVKRLIDTLRPAWRRFEAMAARVLELEARLRDREAHRCPDPDEALREENQRLRGIIERQGLRLEALGRQNNHHRPITEKHLALSGRD